MALLTPQQSGKQIAAVLLAAGRASRFGTDKLSANLEGETILARSAKNLCAANCSHYVGIVPPGSSNRISTLSRLGFHILINEQVDCGLSTSINLGVKWARAHGMDAVLIALADTPFLDVAHFKHLLAKAHSGDAGVAFTLCNGRRSAPAVFCSPWFDALAALSGDMGAKELLIKAPAAAGIVISKPMLADIDTQEDLRDAKSYIKNTTNREKTT